MNRPKITAEQWLAKQAEDMKKMGPHLRKIVEKLSDVRLKWAYNMGIIKMMPVRTGPKIGRNDPCPCGSGKKYKKCCGR